MLDWAASECSFWWVSEEDRVRKGDRTVGVGMADAAAAVLASGDNDLGLTVVHGSMTRGAIVRRSSSTCAWILGADGR